MSEEDFFDSFWERIIGPEPQAEEKEQDDDDRNEPSHQVAFLMHQFKLIPKQSQLLFWNMMRAYPTTPLWIFLCVGMIGTNIARFSAVRRLGADDTNVERTGTLCNIIAPSRFGKGVVISLVSETGSYIEKQLTDAFNRKVEAKQVRLVNPTAHEITSLRLRNSLEQPHLFFLNGGNALQTQTVAAKNAGCGMILVSEIKSGKAAYADPNGAYSPPLDFYDRQIQGSTFQKAEVISTISRCRIQLLGAGIKEDWIPFVERSGPTSGTLARVIPILSYDRDIVRLAQSKLPPASFSLDGLKRAFAVIETAFTNCLVTQETPTITLQFSRSILQQDFCNTNALLIRDLMQDDEINFGGILNILNNRSPPNATEILLKLLERVY